MVLRKDEFRIEDNGIWISKTALRKCKQHYSEVANKYKPKKRDEAIDPNYPFYLGKVNLCIDLLKHFEPLEL